MSPSKAARARETVRSAHGGWRARSGRTSGLQPAGGVLSRASLPRASTLASLLLLAACLSAADAAAATHANNAAAARAYLRATEAYVRDGLRTIASGTAAIEARASEIASECPGALTYAPRDEAFGQISEEVTTELLYAGVGPARPILQRLAVAIEHLTWTNRKLTRLVRERAVEERTIAALALPDVCADIATWKASSYAALPPSSSAFLERAGALQASSSFAPLEEPREAVIVRLLKRYEGPRSRRAAERTEAMEARWSARLEVAATPIRAKLAAALGVSSL